MEISLSLLEAWSKSEEEDRKKQDQKRKEDEARLNEEMAQRGRKAMRDAKLTEIDAMKVDTLLHDLKGDLNRAQEVIEKIKSLGTKKENPNFADELTKREKGISQETGTSLSQGTQTVQSTSEEVKRQGNDASLKLDVLKRNSYSLNLSIYHAGKVLESAKEIFDAMELKGTFPRECRELRREVLDSISRLNRSKGTLSVVMNSSASKDREEKESEAKAA